MLFYTPHEGSLTQVKVKGRQPLWSGRLWRGLDVLCFDFLVQFLVANISIVYLDLS